MTAEGSDPVLALSRVEADLLRSGVEPDQRDRALDTVFLLAVRRPDLVGPATLAALEHVLQAPRMAGEVCDRALDALGAIVYGRPALFGGSIPRVLARLLRSPETPEPTQERICQVLTFLVATGVAGPVVAATQALLASPALAARLHRRLVELLEHAACWRADLVRLGDVVAIAGLGHLAGEREFLLGHVIERLAFTAPESFTPVLLDRLAAVYQDHASFRYLLYYLAGRPATPPEAARLARRRLRGRFPLHAALRAGLGAGKRRVLILQNLADGQGDEITRVGTLAQALLDFNPSFEVVLVTRRVYLYDNPRITPVPISDDPRIRSVLDEAFDAVVDFFEPDVPSLNHRPELESLLQDHLRRRRPFLVAMSRKGHNHFVYETLTIAGAPRAAALGVDRPRLPGTYETTFRLVADLGLPLRAGVETFLTPSLFLDECPEADAEWARLTGSGPRGGPPGDARRPVALVNPFGGLAELKGYSSGRLDVLAEEIARLVAHGFRVVVLPNGTRWGTAAVAEKAMAMLPAVARLHVILVPDLAGADGEVAYRSASGERIVSRSDWAMRCFKYFAARADLVVTVEGWLMHLAYHLGRPYRLLLMPHSHPFGWHPRGASRAQAVVAHMSPAWGDSEPSRDLLTESAGAPCPGHPRKDMLAFVLRGLGELGDPAGILPLEQAHASPDRQVRAVAIEALARHPAASDVLLAALRDKSILVRAAAAHALLEAGRDWTPELGVGYETTLRVHALVAAQRWSEVLALGRVVLQSLSLALDEEDPVIRREATWAFWRVIGKPAASERPDPLMLRALRMFWAPATAGQARFMVCRDEHDRQHWTTDNPEWPTRWREAVLRGVPAGARGKAILDVGCGIGRLMKELAGVATRIVGVDISPQMVEYAKEYLGRCPNAELRVGDGVTIPCDAAEFDLVYSVLCLQHQPSLILVRSMLAEMARVTRTGGCIRVQTRRDVASRRAWARNEPLNGDGWFLTAAELEAELSGLELEITNLEEGLLHPQWVWATARRR